MYLVMFGGTEGTSSTNQLVPMDEPMDLYQLVPQKEPWSAVGTGRNQA